MVIGWLADDAVAYNAVEIGQMLKSFSTKEVEIVYHFCWPLVTQ
jgi:hypothetical protein